MGTELILNKHSLTFSHVCATAMHLTTYGDFCGFYFVSCEIFLTSFNCSPVLRTDFKDTSFCFCISVAWCNIILNLK